MFTNSSEFTMRDDSTRPYAWMIENLDKEDVLASGSVEKFVRSYAKLAINTQNHSHASDTTVYRNWRKGWEFDQAVREITAAINEE